MPHECHFKVKTVKQVESDEGMEWEVWTKTPTCECGEAQPTKDGFPRRPYQRFSQPGTSPRPEGDHYQVTAKSLLQRAANSTRWETVLKTLRVGMGQDTLRSTILALSAYGAVSLCERWQNRWTPWSVVYTNQDLLEEAAHPGRLSRIRQAIGVHIGPLPDCETKAALLDALTPPDASWDEDTVRIAGALIRHQLGGRRSLLRAFSTGMGDSKLVGRHIKRIERVLGSIGDYGIRRPSDMLIVAGHGTLQWTESRIDFLPHHGGLGLERHRLRDLQGIQAQNILFVENKEAFTAIAEGVIKAPTGLAVYMAGNFGSTIEHMLRVSHAKPWMWADLDPFGVSFVRRAKSIRGDLEPYLMEPQFLDGSNCKDLPNAYKDQLERQLEAGGVLQDLLIRIQETGLVKEHEGQALEAVEQIAPAERPSAVR